MKGKHSYPLKEVDVRIIEHNKTINNTLNSSALILAILQKWLRGDGGC